MSTFWGLGPLTGKCAWGLRARLVKQGRQVFEFTKRIRGDWFARAGLGYRSHFKPKDMR